MNLLQLVLGLAIVGGLVLFAAGAWVLAAVAYAVMGWAGPVCLAAGALLALLCDDGFCDAVARRVRRIWRIWR